MKLLKRLVHSYDRAKCLATSIDRYEVEPYNVLRLKKKKAVSLCYSVTKTSSTVNQDLMPMFLYVLNLLFQ